MWESARVYFSSLGWLAVFMLAPVALDIFSIYSLMAGKPNPPGDIWMYAASGFLLTFFLPFVAFHKMRVERDEALGSHRPDIGVERSTVSWAEQVDESQVGTFVIALRNYGATSAHQLTYRESYIKLAPPELLATRDSKDSSRLQSGNSRTVEFQFKTVQERICLALEVSYALTDTGPLKFIDTFWYEVEAGIGGKLAIALRDTVEACEAFLPKAAVTNRQVP